MDSPVVGYVGSSTIVKHLLKRRNVDFLLGESAILITIPGEDTLNLSEGMETKATKPHRPKEVLKKNVDVGGENLGKGLGEKFQQSLLRDDVDVGATPTPSVTSGVFLPEWNLTREFLLMQHSVAYEWSRHEFPPITFGAPIQLPYGQ